MAYQLRQPSVEGFDNYEIPKLSEPTLNYSQIGEQPTMQLNTASGEGAAPAESGMGDVASAGIGAAGTAAQVIASALAQKYMLDQRNAQMEAQRQMDQREHEKSMQLHQEQRGDEALRSGIDAKSDAANQSVSNNLNAESLGRNDKLGVTNMLARAYLTRKQ